jgi:hypothetical protein
VHAAERFGDVQGLTVFEHELLDSFYAIGGAVGVDVASFAGFFDASRCLFEASYEEGRCEGWRRCILDGDGAAARKSWRVGELELGNRKGIEASRTAKCFCMSSLV